MQYLTTVTIICFQADQISKRIINPHEARKESVYTDHFKTCCIDWEQETTKLKEMEVYAVAEKKEQTEVLDKWIKLWICNYHFRQA